LGLPSLAGLLAGMVAALGTAILLCLLVPRLVLGEHGLRTRDTLRAYLLARLRPARMGGSA
jgi:hypothetical protein